MYGRKIFYISSSRYWSLFAHFNNFLLSADIIINDSNPCVGILSNLQQTFLLASVFKHLFPSSYSMAVAWYLLCLTHQHLNLSDVIQSIVIAGQDCKSDFQHVSERMSIFALWFVLFLCTTFSHVILSAMFVIILSLYLFKLGLAPQIQDLYGKVDFTGKPKHKSASVLLVFPIHSKSRHCKR